MPRYIDADKANVEEISCYYGSNCYIEDVQEWLDEQPIADVVEVVHAEWDDDWRCTNCGKEALCEEKPDPYVKGLNALFYVDSDYCPHCGAKMDGKEKR